jgi:mitochondrial import inner membrane translocase subunit TIM50
MFVFIVFHTTQSLIFSFETCLAVGILQPPDVRPILRAYEGKDIATHYAAKEAEMKKIHEEQWRASPEGKRAAAHSVGSFTFSSLFGGPEGVSL